MRIIIAVSGALALAACSSGDSTQWQPSSNSGYQYAPRASDSLIHSGVSADSYDATIANDPTYAYNADALHVSGEIRTHDVMSQQLESDISQRLPQHY